MTRLAMPGQGFAVALSVLLSAASTVALVAAYHLSRPAPPRFATLNVAQLFTERQEELMRLVGEGAGDAGAQRAVELARAFGKRLEAEALALPAECDCIVLVRGAVVAADRLPDYTDLLRERLRRP